MNKLIAVCVASLLVLGTMGACTTQQSQRIADLERAVSEATDNLAEIQANPAATPEEIQAALDAKATALLELWKGIKEEGITSVDNAKNILQSGAWLQNLLILLFGGGATAGVAGRVVMNARNRTSEARIAEVVKKLNGTGKA